MRTNFNIKNILFFTLCSIFTFGVTIVSAQKMTTYKDAYIYGQSQRNKSDAGSALSLGNGLTYAMSDVIKRSNPKSIDVMLVYGKLNKEAIIALGLDANVNTEAGFRLFAPGLPTTADINWDKKSGNFPFRYFTASSKDPEGPAFLKNWSVRNATKLQKVSNIDFDNATVETINALDVKSVYITEPLVEGDIVAFETATTSSSPSKKGLIKIGSIENDENSEKGSEPAFQKINLVVKIVK
ncbi:hypothetical protein FACS1894153_1460 [Bacteroidia bacterium]|nr:hypothetical protein FACS1894153_1460 [Bacteroidia bacterium]